MKTYFIMLGKVKVILDQLQAAKGDFAVAEGFQSAKCDKCGEDIALTGTLYGIPGEEGGASVLCDELDGGCDTSHPVECEDTITFPPLLVTAPSMSDEMTRHIVESRMRRGSGDGVLIVRDWCSECGNTIEPNGTGHKMSCSWR